MLPPTALSHTDTAGAAAAAEGTSGGRPSGGACWHGPQPAQLGGGQPADNSRAAAAGIRA